MLPVFMVPDVICPECGWEMRRHFTELLDKSRLLIECTNPECCNFGTMQRINVGFLMAHSEEV